MKMEPCKCCKGTGEQIDQRALGREMKELREAMGLSLRSVATGLGISAPYLSDLELGKRNWNDARIVEYKKAIKKRQPPKRRK